MKDDERGMLGGLGGDGIDLEEIYRDAIVALRLDIKRFDNWMEVHLAGERKRVSDLREFNEQLSLHAEKERKRYLQEMEKKDLKIIELTRRLLKYEGKK